MANAEQIRTRRNKTIGSDCQQGLDCPQYNIAQLFNFFEPQRLFPSSGKIEIK